MGIETTLGNRKSKFFEMPKEKKRNRRRQKKIFLVQKLFDTCKEVFAYGGSGIIPSPENVQLLRSVLDEMKPVDVGLSPELPSFRKVMGRTTPKITYLPLYEGNDFSMGIFCFPPSGVIPLHNHPGMTVFSKLLFGTMHIKAYDWVDNVSCDTSIVTNPSQATSPGIRLAKVKVDANFTAPCNTSILYPADGGNMHSFTALTACAVLDVQGPPYSYPDGRDCKYFFDFPFSHFSEPSLVDGVKLPEEEKESYAWLQERDIPEDLTFVGSMYRGPKIVLN